MYHVSAQGIDESMINIHYYYYSNPEVNYMVTVFIRLVIAVV